MTEPNPGGATYTVTGRTLNSENGDRERAPNTDGAAICTPTPTACLTKNLGG